MVEWRKLGGDVSSRHRVWSSNVVPTVSLSPFLPTRLSKPTPSFEHRESSSRLGWNHKTSALTVGDRSGPPAWSGAVHSLMSLNLNDRLGSFFPLPEVRGGDAGRWCECRPSRPGAYPRLRPCASRVTGTIDVGGPAALPSGDFAVEFWMLLQREPWDGIFLRRPRSGQRIPDL